MESLHLKVGAPAADRSLVEEPLADLSVEHDLAEPALELIPALDLADQGRTIRLPVHVAEQVRRAMRSRRQLTQKLNRDATVEEIAKDSGFTVERVRELFSLVEDPVSLETPIGDGESMVADMIEDLKSESPDGAHADQARSLELADAVDCLNPRMKHVVLRRFGLDGQPPQTLEEVGNDLGITRERARQLEQRALRELLPVAPVLPLYLQT